MSDGDALGYGKWDGGFAPKLRATDDNLVKLPDEVPFDLGAMATDAGLTAYHAIMAVGGAKKGMKVGMGRLEATISTYPIIINQLTIKGSKSGTKEDLAGIYEIMRSGQLNPPINHITHAEIPEAIDKLREGGVIGRYIAMYE